MKKYLLLACAIIAGSTMAHAQFYEIANQLPQLITPALTGSPNYKGFIETSYTAGVGKYQADILEFTTTQGYNYNNWLFIGAGAGADIMFSHTSDNWGNWQNPGSFDTDHSSATTSVMIPLYSDFRVNFGGSGIRMYADLRLGCAFLVGKDYVRIGNGYVTNSEYFYLRPSVGIRVPVSKTHPKQAVNVGVTYQLLTSNYWYNTSTNATLNSIGANLSFEW